jgi:hypothetical protein
LKIYSMCNIPEIPMNAALTLALSPWERELEMVESPFPQGEGLG